MLVIPAINVKTRDEALARINTISSFNPKAPWIHIDVSDGKFTSATTPWATPAVFQELIIDGQLAMTDFSIHLMVANPEEALEKWISVGARYFVVHEEAVKDFEHIEKIANQYHAEIALSVSLNKEASANLEGFGIFQVLAVRPGFSGQEFDLKALAKIKLLRGLFPNAKIEVDGGMNPRTARLVKSAGADTIVAASYIFNAEDPTKAYQDLIAI